MDGRVVRRSPRQWSIDGALWAALSLAFGYDLARNGRSPPTGPNGTDRP